MVKNEDPLENQSKKLIEAVKRIGLKKNPEKKEHKISQRKVPPDKQNMVRSWKS